MNVNNFFIDPIVMQLYASGKLKYRVYTSADETLKYHCNALPGTALADEAWVVMREHQTTGATDFSNGSYAMNVAATNLTAVEALSYS